MSVMLLLLLLYIIDYQKNKRLNMSDVGIFLYFDKKYFA